MNILVCVKQILNPEARSSDGDTAMNRFDEFAVEAAVRLKDHLAGQGASVRIDVITAGPEGALRAVKRAMGMGADNGVHILAHDSGPVPPQVTASRIARAVANRHYDLVITGIMAEDTLDGQVGPMLAEQIDVACATAVVSLEALPDSGTLLVERELEEGLRDCLEIQLPALITVQAGINTPRYPSLSRILAADRKPIPTIDADSLAAGITWPGSRQTFLELPRKTRQGRVLQGSCQEKAAQLKALLREKDLL